MNTTFFEATPAQKQLAQIGREMMDFSENYGKIHGLKDVTDDGLRTLNSLSQVGYMLTTFGAVYGASVSSFSAEEKELISKFMQKEVDIERK
jgi:hypothetical protein